MHTAEKQRPHGVEAYAVNRFGHAAGRKLATGLWKREWVRRLAAQNPELARIISEGAIALTSMLEMGGDSTIVRMLNFIAESFSMESLELLEKFEQNPDDPDLAKQVEQKIDAAVEKAEKDVIVALEHIHVDDKCAMVAQYVKDATPPSFGGKPGQPPRVNPSAARLYPMSLSQALAAHKPLCGLCYPALSFRKVEEKAKPKEVTPGRNFMEHLMRLRTEEPKEFETFWKAYLLRLEGPDGVELGRKFQDAFDGKFGYDAFRFVVSLPHRSELGSEEWHTALDALLGKVTAPASLKAKIEGFLDKEVRQTEEMFEALYAWLAKSNAERAEKISAKRAAIQELDDAWEAEKRSRKNGKRMKRIVLFALLAILVSWKVIDHVTDNNSTRSDASEQKDEAPNVR